MAPLISVITAVYNCADTVARSVASIACQTCGDYEHLIVDDGSIDASGTIASALATCDSRIRVIQQENRGPGGARNTGLAVARGEFIAILDADDVSTEDRFRLQVEFLSDHPEVDVLGGGARLIDDSGVVIGFSRPPRDHDTLIRNIYHRCPFMHSTVMARKTFFDKMGGYDVGLRRCQDYDLWLRGYRTARFHNLSQTLIDYRVRPRPWFVSSFYSARVLLRAARRDGLLLSHSWLAVRPVLATALIHAGLRRADHRKVTDE